MKHSLFKLSTIIFTGITTIFVACDFFDTGINSNPKNFTGENKDSTTVEDSTNVPLDSISNNIIHIQNLNTDTNSGYKIINNYKYTKEEDNKLILKKKDNVFKTVYCYDTTLMSTFDTISFGNITMKYKQYGNSLIITNDIYSLDTLSSGTIILYHEIYHRTNSESGILGLWGLTDEYYDVISGTLTSEDVEEIKNDAKDLLEFNFILKITDNSMTIYTIEPLYYWIKNVFPNLQNSDITIKNISSNEMSLTGNKTDEIIDISINSTNDITYASETESHTYYETPTFCPNDFTPKWFDTFLKENGDSEDVEGIGKVMVKQVQRSQKFGKASFSYYLKK